MINTITVSSVRRIVIALLAVCLLSATTPLRADTPNSTTAVSWISATPTARFRGIYDWLVDVGQRTPAEVYGPFVTRKYTLGSVDSFFALDFGSTQTPPRRMKATLKLVTAHAYWWFEDGTTVDSAALKAAGARFENDIYPLDQRVFGDNWLGGIDGDPHIFLMHQKKIGGYAVGVFSPLDECAKAICANSNQHEMLYIGLDFGPVGSPQELTVISHEMQHLIQYNVNGNQQRWLDEGFAQLAEHLNGFDPHLIANSNLSDFLQNPNFQLNTWPASSAIDPALNYAAGYIFCVYLYQRFGASFIHYLTNSPYKGLASVEHALAVLNTGETLDQVFADWTITNYANNPYIADGRYAYQSLKLPARAGTVAIQSDTPQSDVVQEYGAEYLSLRESGHYTLHFKGDSTVQLTDARPTSGKWMWWSFNEPRGASRLERAFDLSNAHNAQLAFNAWWDIQERRDLAQVLVSTDNGASWTVIRGAHTHDCALGGACYDGRSQGWVKETVDLSAYDGQQIRVRFEYLTQGGNIGTGFFVDDIRLDALQFKDDVEGGINGWQASGFTRVTQDIPQHWAVNLITADNPPKVIPVTLDTNNTAQFNFDAPAKGVVIVVGAMAPFVTGSASYALTVSSNAG